ncbi:MAG TPA: hypothetical protein PL124_13035 [Candidatus Cloacimonadota bacterium]|nr:hypothetical protein [Candidatus Cloacimonadota bacterium]
MAKLIDLQEVCTRVGLSLTTAQLEVVAKSTPEIQDIDRLSDALILKGKVTIASLKRAIYAQPKPKPEGCGKCWSPFGIPLLDTHVHREAEAMGTTQYDWLMIPSVYVPCPNCSGVNRAAVLTDRMSDDERAWTWILLYDFFVFKLQQSIEPKDFNPSDYWEGIQGGVEFSPHQETLITKIYEASQARGNVIEYPQNIIQKLTQQTLRPIVTADAIPF